MFDLNSESGTSGGPEAHSFGWIASRFAYIRDTGWFSFEGRISRGDYWIAVLWGHLLPMVITLPLMIPGILLGTSMGASAMVRFVGGVLVILSSVVFTGLYFWALSAAIVKRFHDLNLTGWVALIYLPLIYFYPILLILQGSIKGTNGPNRYGTDPVAVAEMRIS